MSLTNTDIDNSPLVYTCEKSEQGALTLAGADTIAAGTVLARDSVSLKWVLFVVGGSTNENGIPKGVLLNEVTSTGAGDVQATVLVKGRVNLNAMIVDDDQDTDDMTAAHFDILRSYGIDVETPTQLSAYDNS